MAFGFDHCVLVNLASSLKKRLDGIAMLTLSGKGFDLLVDIGWADGVDNPQLLGTLAECVMPASGIGLLGFAVIVVVQLLPILETAITAESGMVFC